MVGVKYSSGRSTVHTSFIEKKKKRSPSFAGWRLCVMLVFLFLQRWGGLMTSATNLAALRSLVVCTP